jgi:hypothetical protein
LLNKPLQLVAHVASRTVSGTKKCGELPPHSSRGPWCRA